MPHEITNYEKKYYTIKCEKCGKQWRRHKSCISLKKTKGANDYSAVDAPSYLSLDTCAACHTESTIHSTMSRWRLWKKENPIFRPYQVEVKSNLGSIAFIRFDLVKAVKAQGTNAPYLVASNSYPMVVHGEFSTSALWTLRLNEQCTFESGKYNVNPFDIIVVCGNIIVYKLENVAIRGGNPLVQTNEKNQTGILAPNVDFIAFLCYLDPIWTKT